MKTIRLSGVALFAAALLFFAGCGKVNVMNISGQSQTYGSASIKKGALWGKITVEAAAAEGYFFEYWVAADDRKADTVSTANPLTFKRGTYKTLYPVFNKNGADADNPVEIYTATELTLMASGDSWSRQWRKEAHYKLMEDIACDWNGYVVKDFSGVLDGDGHVITLDGALSLFNFVRKSGVVKNLGVAGSCTKAGIAFYNDGVIECCMVAAEIIGNSNVGGISRSSIGTIRNCRVAGNVTSQGNDGEVKAAGIVQANFGSISNCLVSGTVAAVAESDKVDEPEATGIAVNLETISGCVVTSPSIYATGGSKPGMYRIGIIGKYENNYALADMQGSKWTNKGLTELDGADVTVLQLQSEAWWADAKTGIWKDVWGGTEPDKPWKWDAGRKMPVLWWEK